MRKIFRKGDRVKVPRFEGRGYWFGTVVHIDRNYFDVNFDNLDGPPYHYTWDDYHDVKLVYNGLQYLKERHNL